MSLIPCDSSKDVPGLAPYDGRDVLVYAAGYIYQAAWKKGKRNGRAYMGFQRRPAEQQGKWIDDVTFWMPVPNDATSWMPVR